MGRPLTLLSGAIAGFGLYRFVASRRRRPAYTPPPPPEPAADPRAEELRRKLAESRPLVEEREEFESAETPVDLADTSREVDERRQQVHRQGRQIAERIRRRRPGD